MLQHGHQNKVRILKFKLNRAKFKTGQTNKITFTNDVVPTTKLQANALFTTSGSAVIKVLHKNHGLHHTSSRAVITGVVGTGSPQKINNIPITEINGVTHTISAITHDTYSITVSTNANASGYAGGASIKAQGNRHMDLLYPVIQNMQVPGTSARFFLKTYTSRSANGSETGYALTGSGDGYEILPNRNFYFPVPMAIYSAINESTQGIGKSFQLTCVMTSTNDALSPVIDMNRLSANSIQNIITSTGVSEEVTSGGGEISKYITKKIELAEQADIATVFVNVLKPGGSDVELYFRAVNGDTDINTVAFDKVDPVGGSIPFNETAFQEAQFDIDPFGINASFSAIQFKLVLKGTNSSQPPLVKDFRAICAT